MSIKTFLSYAFVFVLGWFVAWSSNTKQPVISQLVVADIESEITEQKDDSYLNSLYQLISEYKQKLTDLEKDNDSLVKDLFDSQMKSTLLAAQPTVIKKINNASDEEVRKKISEYFRESYLTNVDDPKAFATRLSELALTDEETDASDDVANVDVRISVSMLPGYHEMTGDSVGASKYRRMYVNMMSSSPVPNALIKWKYMTEDKLLLFKGLAFHPRDNYSFVWVMPDSGGWKRGLYQVNVYQMNNELTLLATKTYTVNEVIDEGEEEHPEVPEVDGPPLKMLRQ